jgi:putative membrane protein
MQEGSPKKQNLNDHQANERTLLAWVRTCIAIMAFGFVVVKFSLFVRQIDLILGKQTIVHQQGHSVPIGISLVAAGAVALLLALLSYHNTKREIDNDTYRHNSWLLYTMVGFVLLVSIALLIYLFKTT